MAQLPGQAEVDLLGLVSGKRIVARSIVGLPFGHSLASDLLLDRDLRGTEARQDVGGLQINEVFDRTRLAV